MKATIEELLTGTEPNPATRPHPRKQSLGTRHEARPADLHTILICSGITCEEELDVKDCN